MWSSCTASRSGLAIWIALIVVTITYGCNDQKQKPVTVSAPDKKVSPQIKQFHEVVKHGSLAELKQELTRIDDLNAPGRNGINAIMIALDTKDLQKTKLLIEHGADPELTDDNNRTALRHAVGANYLDGVRYLLNLGVDQGYHPKYPLKKIDYDLDLFSDAEMPAEMKGLMTEEEWKESFTEINEMLVEAGQNPTVEPIIADVYDVEILKLFLEAGNDLSQASDEMKRLYIGLEKEGDFQASPADYKKHKFPGFGSSNPTRMDNPFWKDMIRIGCSAYRAREHFNDPGPFKVPGAVWCFDRHGSSLTQLADGRFVQIAGEHEDHYDPDFNIYNDVVIHNGKGGMEIYGFPKEIFSPTDFHSATLVKDRIYIIGCLGYPEQREVGVTPVFQLKIDTWKISPVKTSGTMPGWIYNHRAKYNPEKNVIRIKAGEQVILDENDESETVRNEDKYELDLSSFEWRKR